MSRVITCPPLVIPRNQARVQNLVQSTKLERITIDSKKACGIEKVEKKEKHKKEKKDTKREKSHKHSSRKADDNHHKEQLISSKKVSDESDQLEKSGLTEELEEPQNQLGYLSDGSQNSKKRKRADSPPAVESLIKAARVAGNPLRFRLIIKKPVLPQEDVVCSTLDAKSLNHHNVITSSISGSKISEPEEIQPSTFVAAIVETKKIKKHRPSKEDRYNALFDDWTPSSICFADNSFLKNNDDEWLFGNKRQETLKPKAAVKIDEDMKIRSGDSSWPRARLLSEVGIYSLPYTVPF